MYKRNNQKKPCDIRSYNLFFLKVESDTFSGLLFNFVLQLSVYCVMFAQTLQTRRRRQIFWTWSYRQLWVTVAVLITSLGPPQVQKLLLTTEASLKSHSNMFFSFPFKLKFAFLFDIGSTFYCACNW